MGKRIAVALAVVAMMVLAPSATNAATKVVTGSVSDGFLPPTLKVNLGDTVRWEADDLAQHNATSKDGTTFAKNFGPTQPGVWVANKAGSFPYICTIHGEQAMSGTIIVKAAPTTTTTRPTTTTTAATTTTMAPATTTTAPSSTSSTDSSTTSSSSSSSTSTTIDTDTSEAAVTIVDEDGGGGGGSGTTIAIAALVIGALVAGSGAWLLWKRGELAPGNDR